MTCSGLVMAAFGHGAGIWLPHSTYAMLGSRHLHRIALSQARRGDLMFYGSGHVEINTIWYHMTFGAHHSGQRVGWRKWSPWWHPTAPTGSGDPGQTARRQGAVRRSPARRAVPGPAAPDPPPGIPASVRSRCWRVRHCPEKACAVITLPPSLPAQAFALPGHTAAGRVILAGRRC